MVNRHDSDELVSGPPPPPAPDAADAATPAGSSMPTHEPAGSSMHEQRKELARRVSVLEGTLRYMGTAHPRRNALKGQLDELRAMLAQIDRALGNDTSA